MTVLIGIAGPAGSGKTTVANYLARTYGARVYALATPLKEIVRRAFSLSDEQLYGSQAVKEAIDERYNVSPRWLMQRIGTEGVRNTLGQDFWTKYTLQLIEAHRPKLAVIEDVRFWSEAEGIMDYAFHDNRSLPEAYIWKLQPFWCEAKGDHQSESEFDKLPHHHVITPPQRTLKALYEEIDKACAKFGILPTLHSQEAP